MISRFSDYYEKNRSRRLRYWWTLMLQFCEPNFPGRFQSIAVVYDWPSYLYNHIISEQVSITGRRIKQTSDRLIATPLAIEYWYILEQMFSLCSTVLFNQSIVHPSTSTVRWPKFFPYRPFFFISFFTIQNTHPIRLLGENEWVKFAKSRNDPNHYICEHVAGSHVVFFIDIFNIHTELDADASSCCWKWWKAIRSFLVRSGVVVEPIVFVLLLLFRLPIPGDENCC